MRKFLTICLALLGIGLGGTVVAQTIGSVSNGYIEEGNLYRPGNIIKTIMMSNRGQDAVTCRRECDADSNCNAYLYLQEAPNRKPICYLRMLSLPHQARRDHGFTKVVAGTKLSLLRDVHEITPYPSRAIQGGVKLRSFKVLNEDPIACSDACYREGNCTGYTHKPRTVLPKSAPAMCTLFSKNGTLTANTKVGYLSGSKTPLSVPRGSRLPTRSGTAPTARPALSPKRPVIQRPSGQTITIPDQTPEDNPSLSDDDDAQFPGEMLEPEKR